MDLVYPWTRRQRCRMHKLRNVSKKLRRRHRKSCLQEARSIYLACNRPETIHCFGTWQHHWEALGA